MPQDSLNIYRGRLSECINIDVYEYSGDILIEYHTGLLDLEDTLKKIKEDARQGL